MSASKHDPDVWRWINEHSVARGFEGNRLCCFIEARPNLEVNLEAVRCHIASQFAGRAKPCCRAALRSRLEHGKALALSMDLYATWVESGLWIDEA